MSKPIVVYQSKNKEGKIVLTPAEFEKYLEEAYNQGHADGYSEGFKDGNRPSITSPSLPVTPSDPWRTNPLNPDIPYSPYWTTTGTEPCTKVTVTADASEEKSC
jgi:hypothetical protein